MVQPRMLYSDAGGHRAGGCMVINKEVMEVSVFQVNLAEEEVAKSSTYGELRGLQGSGELDQRQERPVAL